MGNIGTLYYTRNLIFAFVTYKKHMRLLSSISMYLVEVLQAVKEVNAILVNIAVHAEYTISANEPTHDHQQ